MPKTSRRRGRCKVCDRIGAVKGDGTMFAHTRTTGRCPGSSTLAGPLPKPATTGATP